MFSDDQDGHYVRRSILLSGNPSDEIISTQGFPAASLPPEPPTPLSDARIADLREKLGRPGMLRIAGIPKPEEVESMLNELCALRAEAAALKAERELFVDTVRLVGRSSWDAPGWTLHVPHERATILFDIAYGHVADPKPTESAEERAIRERFKALRAARSASGEDRHG